VAAVLIEETAAIADEWYLSVTFDRGARKALLMLTTEGGVEIEEVARTSPEALSRLHVDPLAGFRPFAARRLVFGAGIDDAALGAQALDVVERLYRCFAESDAMLCEINPLVVTGAGELLALDAKVTIDDSALARQPELAELRDLTAADPLEALARERHVTYVRLDGSVAVLANGAGLAMSTLDVVSVVGGRPANFCDLGGGGDADGVVDALEVISRDEHVRSILFNIFGGMTRCDEVARGILAALDRVQLSAPIVVRFDGTNAEEGRELLAASGRGGIHFEATMLDAARRATELAA
jgi:succinyl-CoA synthetase beta subunit